jgi:tRNA A-37 threonylcarbamoyl transferase component Bud32
MTESSNDDQDEIQGSEQPPKAETPKPDVSIPTWMESLGGETMLDMSKPGAPQQNQDATIVPASDDVSGQTIFPDPANGLLELKVDQMVHAYRIEANPDPESAHNYIGVGASGVIYRARHDYLDRLVALKFLKKDDASLEELEQFKAEAKVIAGLQGKNILQVYDFSEWNDSLFMAMELLEGGSAIDRIKGQFGEPSSSGIWNKVSSLLKKTEAPESKPVEYLTRPQDIEYFVKTIIHVGEQLEIAHNNGVLHRDIKPGNIMYRDAEQKDAVLVDYGLAALIKAENTKTGGTPAFMAPEQIGEGAPIDARTDVFGLGATLYNMLTGKYVHNFQGGETIEQLAAIIIAGNTMNVRQHNRKVDRNLAAIIHKAVEKHPYNRYDSTRDFYEDLKRWLDGKSVRVRPALSFAIPSARRLRKRGFYWASAVVLSATLVGLAASLYQAREPVRQRDARVENYISGINASKSEADSLRELANNFYELFRKKSLVELFNENTQLSELTDHQKTISKVLDSYSKALKLSEEWKKEDVAPEKKSEEKVRELDVLVKEFEKKNDYAVQKVDAYAKILEARQSYADKDFSKAEKDLALSLDRLYEVDTQKELIRVQEEHSMYQKQRTMQGVRDIATRVREYRRICRACFMDEIEVFSGSEDEIAPERGIEWKKMMGGIESILKTPDDAVLGKIQLDTKTYGDLIEQAKTDAQEAFYSEQSILKNKDVKHAIDLKRNKIAEDKYISDVSELYKSGKIEEDEFKARMRLPLPSQREFIDELENDFKKGRVSKKLYDKLKIDK